jgi:hypothetical protein
MARAHLYKPIQDTEGRLRLNAVVRVLQPGTTTPYTSPLYAADSGSSTVSNPFTATSGIIDFYIEDSVRVRLGITVGAEPEFFVEDVDVLEVVAAGVSAAEDVAFTPTGTVGADNVQDAIVEVATEAASALQAHLDDTTDAHDASAISYGGGSSISATNVEAALDELSLEKYGPDNPPPSTGGVQSTTGFGLPTTSGRSAGDLHYDTQGLREYVLSSGAWVPTSGSVTSQGSGLPSFAGRVPGDHHFDTAVSKDYVLNGVASGNTATDTFTRSGNVNGSTTEGGGYTWLTGAQSPAPISGNQVVCDRFGLYGSLLELGSTAQSVQFTYSYANGGLEQAVIRLRAAASTNDGYAVASTNGGGDQGISVWSAGTGSGSPLSTKLVQLTTSTEVAGGTLQADINSTGLITVRKGGTVVGTYQTDNSKTGTKAGFAGGGGFTGAVTYIDNMVILNPGTLVWTLASPQKETVNAANSGSSVTLPDPTTGATYNRITLNAATPAVNLPTPSLGATFTLELVQDATGGRVPSFATPSGTIKWATPGNVAPTITSTATKADIITGMCSDGTNWILFVAAQGV